MYLSIYRFISIFCTLCCIVLFSCSFITNPYLFSVVFGISLGSLSSCIFLPSLWIIWSWLPDIKSFVSGLMLTAYNFGPVPFTFLFTMLVNPYNNKSILEDNEGNKMFERNTAENVPLVIQVFSISLLICFWVRLLLIPSELKKSDTNETNEIQGKSLNDLLKNPKFWNLFIMMTLSYFCQNYFLMFYKVITLKYFDDDSFSTYLGVTYFITRGLGNLAFGYLIQRFYWKNTMIPIFFIKTVLMLALWFCLDYKLLYGFIVILLAFISGALYINVLMLTEKEFPSDKKAISYVCLSFIISFYMIYFMEKYITPFIGYFLTFVIVAFLSFILLLQTIFYRDPKQGKLLD